MLDPWIIEQIRRREEERSRRPPGEHRPAVDMPDYRRPPPGHGPGHDSHEDREPPPSDRGVVIIDFGV